MKLSCKHKQVEHWVMGFNFIATAAVIAIFVMLYGFDWVVLPLAVLHAAEVVLCFYFFAEKITRFFNAESKRRFLRSNWFEIPLFLVLLLIAGGAADRWFPLLDRDVVLLPAVSVYLVLQVLSKVCLGMVRFASTGKNPTMGLIILFVILICAGAGLLTLPKAHNLESMSITDAFFTATSATCVTGLVVADTGRDFSLMGQTIILILIQLGGLGIVVFGAVLALLLGQALSVKESLAMQDLLSAQTLRNISMMIGFIFLFTIVIEAIGAVSLMPMWDNVPNALPHPDMKWFYSVFHSISAFCNAGFSLFNTSLIDYDTSFGVYTVIAPLIILGGLGFGVLYNLMLVATDRVKRFIRRWFRPDSALTMGLPRRISLQTKIVLSASLILIVVGTILLMLFERCPSQTEHCGQFRTALFQSITARTAGFNTVNIAVLSEASKMVLMMLMFIGGSPGSTAGGIKTVTLALVIMVIYATLRKRREVELFKRSIRLAVVGRAITVLLLFAGLLILMTMLLTLSECGRGWSLLDLAFETTSALGTVGLSTGVTPTLTTAGKWIIIATMLIGRLGPLTLLVGLTFNLKPASYDYPTEPLMVG